MRIAILTLDFPPYRSSGLTLYAESVVRALVGQGHTVTVITALRPDDRWTEAAKVDDRVSVVRVAIGGFDWIGFGAGAARYLRAHRSMFDAIHFMDVHFAYAFGGSFSASVLQSFRQRLVSAPRGPYHTSWCNYLFRLIYYNAAWRLMEQPAAARARHLVATSESTRCEFTECYGIDPARMSLIHIGVDSRRFSDLPPQAVARERLQLPPGMPTLLYVGFSTPRKGVEYLARALSTMRTRAHLVMVGKWESGYLARFVEDLGEARSRVTIAGYVADNALLDYYAAADVFVLPTLLEGFGIPLVEAMASGIPIVTTNGGSAGEIAGAAAITVPTADSRALAGAIDRVFLERGLADALRSCGKERAQLFDEGRISGLLDELFRRVWGQDGH